MQSYTGAFSELNTFIPDVGNSFNLYSSEEAIGRFIIISSSSSSLSVRIDEDYNPKFMQSGHY